MVPAFVFIVLYDSINPTAQEETVNTSLGHRGFCIQLISVLFCLFVCVEQTVNADDSTSKIFE